MNKKPYKILITGGAGYVGSVLVPELLKLGNFVTVLDNLSVGGHGLLANFAHPKFAFIKGDIKDFEAVKKAVTGMDFVIHLAAIVGYPSCRKDPQSSRAINVDGTKNVVKAMNGKQKIIFASTTSAYGKLIQKYCTETSPLKPLSDYGKQKMLAEKIVQKHKNNVIFRFSTAFGVSPRLRLDVLINDFAYRACKEKTIIVYEKDFMRSFIHVRDMASSFIHAIENFDNMKGEAYNTGDETLSFTKEQVAKTLLKYTDYYLHFADSGKDMEQRDFIVDYSKIKATGFKCKVGLDQALKELIKAMEVVEITNPYSKI